MAPIKPHKLNANELEYYVNAKNEWTAQLTDGTERPATQEEINEEAPF